MNPVRGQCNSVKALDGNLVDAIIVSGIGVGAINKLNDMDFKVYSAPGSSVLENISLFESNKISELTVECDCGDHAGDCEH